MEIAPGETATSPLEMVMPAATIDVYVNLYYGIADQGEATYGGYLGPYTILVKVDEWVHLEKPDWLRKTLDGEWLDNLWGGLGGYIFAPLKPLFWSLGWLIEKAVDVLLSLLNQVINWSKDAWDRQWEQNIGLAGMIRELTDEQGWLHNLLQTPQALARLLLGPLYDELIKLPFFKQLSDMYNMLTDFLPDDWAELKNLLTNPVDYFFDRLDEWLNEEE
jgi:hypothetical protein